MSKKMRYFLFVLLLIVPLILAACGGDDDDDDGDNGGNGGNGGGDAVTLSQSFDSATGVSFKYPEGWVTDDTDQGPGAASSQALYDKMDDPDASPTSDEAAVIFLAMPTADLGMEGADLATVFDMMLGGMTGEGMETTGDVQDVTLGGNEGKKVTVRDSESGSEGFVAAFMQGDAVIIGIMITGEGGMGQFEATATSIVGSATYTAPAG